MINSVAKLDHRYGLGGISVNVRLLPSLFKSEDGREAVRAFVREAMRKGCFELQMNVVDGETLREAKAHPELYRDLTVRIAGYSEYFCNVGEALQDELIARAEYRGV
jgi:formate C-acetyltransferase